MKKQRLWILIASLFLLLGCDGAKTDLEQALAANYREDTDLKDYNVDPQDMAECVADEIAGTIPAFPGTPQRKVYYEAYTKLVKVMATDQDPKAVLEETQEVFGSVREARKAALGVTAFVLDCMGELVDTQ